ncbi:MAG: hypothetical protein HDS11_04340 [Bacteroides sp.]|nr:hypothetical protein [Bacteroides sp.]
MQDIFSEQSNPSMNHVFSEKGSQAFHFTGINLNFLGGVMRFADISLIIMALVGIMFLIFSNVGNSGDAKWRGANLLILPYALCVFLHLFVTILASYSNLSGGRTHAFLMMILGETILIAGSILLYFYGVIFREISMMSGEPNLKRRSETAFNSMQYVLIGASVLIMGGSFF